MAIKSSLPTQRKTPGALGKRRERLPGDAFLFCPERSSVDQPDVGNGIKASHKMYTTQGGSEGMKGTRSSIQIERYENIDLLAREWDELADRVQAAPWLRPGWIAAWRRAFGKGTLEILAVRRDQQLAGVLPLQSRFGELSSTTNWHTPQFGLLAEDSAAAQELAHAVFACRSRRVNLGFLALEGAGLHECRTAATAAGYRQFVRTIQRSPYVPIESDWAEYKRRLSAKRLSEIRRRRRLLEAEGKLLLQIVDGSERLEEFLEEGFWLEAAAWKGAAGSAIISRPQTHQFYSEVARWGAERGVLRLAFLRLNSCPLAFDYCLEEGGVHYLVKTGYNPAYGKFGPGLIIRYEMLARAFSIGLRTYEFLGTDQPWKFEWADKVRELALLRTFSPSPSGFLEWAAFAYGRPLAKSILTAVNRL